MQINVTVDGADGIDLTTVAGDESWTYNPDTEEYEYAPRTLGDLVAEKLAERLWSASTDRQDLYRKALEKRDEVIREQITPIIAKVLSGRVTPTNAFGEEAGSPVTLTELIVMEAEKALAPKGKRYSREPTLLEQLLAEHVGAAFRNELTAIIAEEKKKVVSAVRESAGTIIADAVQRGLSAR